MNRQVRRSNLLAAAVFIVLLTAAAPVPAAFNDTPTNWSNFFGDDGFVIPYTYLGGPIQDMHGSTTDATRDGAAVSPANQDLASGSPTANPGPYETPLYGYYNGGTIYDPDDPSTMQDDYILFRIRVKEDPTKSQGFVAGNWNVLLDVDRDGFKEYWIDLDGGYQANNPDAVYILYDDTARQDFAIPYTQQAEWRAAYLVDEFTAANAAGSYSHTRAVACADGTGNWWIDVQIPMTAFKDMLGNQVLFPNTAVGFVYTTGDNNNDPLKKDWMFDLGLLDTAVRTDPINFGDIIRSDGEPDLFFANSSLEPVYFYSPGDDIYLYNHYPAANSSATTVDQLTVTVTDPVTGDDEQVTLYETGPNTGIFTNRGGADRPVSTSLTREWINFVTTSATTGAAAWRAVYYSATGTWQVQKYVGGAWVSQGARVAAGTAYTSPGGEVSLTIYQNGPANGDTVTFNTFAADPLPSSDTTGGGDDNGTLLVSGGETIYFAYTTADSVTYTAEAAILGEGVPFIQFTRVNGLPCEDFQLTSDPDTSDSLYVTVYHDPDLYDPDVVDTIQVQLSTPAGYTGGNDLQTLTLTETGPNTGVFRNTTGLPTMILSADNDPGVNVSPWEDVDGGTVQAAYTYDGTEYATQASLFAIDVAGRVYFTNGAGTVGVDDYTVNQPIFIRLEDKNWVECDGYAGVQVTVSSSSGDSERLTLYETIAGSQVFMNRANDLVTTIDSTDVSSASTDFSGLTAGDPFVIATGPDAGTYSVVSVVSTNVVRLDGIMSESRAGISFNAVPLMTAVSDGTPTADNGVLEATHGDTLTVTYDDCSDGDNDAANDIKTDTASFNSPPVLINEVLFYPDYQYGQTEFIQLYNSSATGQNITGYTVTDGDGFSYQIPTLGGADITLLAGEKAYVFLYNDPLVAGNSFYDSATGAYYLFTGLNETPWPDADWYADRLGDPAAAVPEDGADQIILSDALGTVVDYVGWSGTLTPSMDFRSDDSPAVIGGIWTDDAYRDVRDIAGRGYDIHRLSDGFDTNRPSDWTYGTTTDVWGPVITQAVVTSFETLERDGRVVAVWRTSSEALTVGFRLFRRDEEGGPWLRLDEGLIPGLCRPPMGGVYSFEDTSAQPGRIYTYRIEEVESGGRTFFHGPYRVSSRPGDGRDVYEPGRRQPVLAAGKPAREAFQARLSRAAVAPPPSGDRPDAVKIPVREAGIHFLSTRRIAALLEMGEAQVASLIAREGLRLSGNGELVAYRAAPGGKGIYFYGRPVRDLYGDEGIYWLAPGRGVRMLGTYGPAGVRTPAPPYFRSSLTLEEDAWPLPGFFEDPSADYWFWDYLLAGSAGEGTRTYAFDTAAASPGKAYLGLRLLGLTDTEAVVDHHASIDLNGVHVGDCWLEGAAMKDCTYALPAGVLKASGNSLAVTAALDTAAPYSTIFLDSIKLSYRRAMRAVDDTFGFRAGAASRVSAGGFSSNRVALYDITWPSRPRVVINAAVVPDGSSFRLVFSAVAGSNYLAVAPGAVIEVTGAKAARRAGLASPARSADYVIITTAPLMEAARVLADHRSAQGLESLVVDYEDVVNEFNRGRPGPQAIRAFLSFARGRWAKAPRYVVLAGNGTFDYRDRQKFGDNLIPTLMTGTGKGLAPSDGLLADTDGDGVPDLALGRLPVTGVAELENLVAKIIAQEAFFAAGPRTVVLAADVPDGAGNFVADSERVSGVIPPGQAREKIYLSDLGLARARGDLASAVAAGASFLNYFGHAGLDQLTRDGLLRLGDVDGLGGANGLPVVTAMTCVAGYYAFPGYDVLGERLLLSPGGAAAFWGPTGFSVDKSAVLLAEEFYRAVFAGGEGVLGDAILLALKRSAERGAPSFMTAAYNLLGDPAMRIR